MGSNESTSNSVDRREVKRSAVNAYLSLKKGQGDRKPQRRIQVGLLERMGETAKGGEMGN